MDGSAPLVHKGAARPIEITMEQRGGHKSVTRIAGLETFGVVPEQFAREMQKKLATSATGARGLGPQSRAPYCRLQAHAHRMATTSPRPPPPAAVVRQ